MAVDVDMCLEKLLSQQCFPVNHTLMWAKKVMSESISGLLLTSVPLVFYP